MMRKARMHAAQMHGVLTAVGALLTGGALLFLSLVPDVPSEVSEITAWVDSGKSLLSLSDELLFFAIVCWGAGARGLFGAQKVERSARINVGLTALAVALVALVVLLLVVGRLVYPVFGIHLSPEVLALLVSSTFGAVHLALLGFAVAAVALSWSTRSGLLGRIVGIVAAVVFIVGSFPWLIPSWWNALVAVLLAAWGVFLGVIGVAQHGNEGGV
ncbi:hypothetical protein AB0I28_14285 [Phytomonospora sp. NPDC050363]|uniref:hypothetical protein n=1 Tax=Phytomonospora sp. NPDC050363 TaxID=3155642 RepID=UPI0033C4E662